MKASSSDQQQSTVITAQRVYKNFVLPHEQNRSVKQAFTGMFTSNRSVETQRALKDISFDVKEGEFFGIVGRNGSGKSTLLKILAGIYQPTKGSVDVRGKLVPFIELGVGFNPELTGRENIYLNGALLGFSKKEIDVMYDGIVEFAELERFMDQKLKNYSSGMQVRLAFSLAIRAEADILLIDEVLAVGDADFQRKCFEYFKELKANNKTVVFVTHDMNAVREYCDRAMLIDNNEVKLIGTPTDIAREYSLLFMENAEENVQESKDGKRWGNGDVRITKVTAQHDKGDIVIDVDMLIKRPVDILIYGLHINSKDGTEITAMNNRMIQQPDLTNVAVGSTVHFSWRMLNIFNDGTYSVTLTTINGVADTLDWYTNAASFKVKRLERSTTAVLPPVSVSSNVTKKEK